MTLGSLAPLLRNEFVQNIVANIMFIPSLASVSGVDA